VAGFPPPIGYDDRSNFPTSYGDSPNPLSGVMIVTIDWFRLNIIHDGFDDFSGNSGRYKHCFAHITGFQPPRHTVIQTLSRLPLPIFVGRTVGDQQAIMIRLYL